MSEEHYLVGTLDKGLRVLDLLRHSPRPLRIAEVAEGTGLGRGTVFRLLYTLQRHGLVDRLPDKTYRAGTLRRVARIGYCGHLEGTPFRRDVTAGLRRAAEVHGIDLLLLENREENPRANLENARRVIEARVDLVLEFQRIEAIAQVLADLFSAARIPVVAVETPMPGAVFFGANNYRAGRMAGEVLARFARERWKGAFDRLLLVGFPRRESGPEARLIGAADAVREALGPFEEARVVRIACRPERAAARAATAAALRRLREERRLLVAAFNDPSALGVVEAVRAAGREDQVAVVGQNGTEESRRELRDSAGPLVASIAYFPERYGERLLPLALSLLNRENVPLAVYTEHAVLDRATLGTHYPDG